MKNNYLALSFLLCTLISIFSLSALAQDAVPGDACSANNSITNTGGVENTGIGYHMVCQGGAWVRIFESDTGGNLGVGQAAPKAPLHVGGEAIVGSTGLTCNTDRKGGLRWNDGDTRLELCDGTSWGEISLSLIHI